MEKSILITKSARYFQEGNLDAKKLVVVLHGYGQLPSYFIRKFEVLFNDWKVVAPEGLHRFYVNGHAGRVGASWMTKEAREMDIHDNMNYLNSLVEQLISRQEYEEIVILGFSQGGATAARFFYQSKLPLTKLVIWASVLPPDLDPNSFFSTELDHKTTAFVLGDEDPFFTKEQQLEVKEYFSKMGYQIHTFQGKHDIDEKTLEVVMEKA